jgi:hypothetical protein
VWLRKQGRLESWAAGMIAGRACVLVAVALALAGCASIEETAFAPNMVRLDVKPYAATFVREATLRRAAELTVQNGYSAFRLMPIYVHAFDDFGVTVVMFHVGDPSARGGYSQEIWRLIDLGNQEPPASSSRMGISRG